MPSPDQFIQALNASDLSVGRMRLSATTGDNRSRSADPYHRIFVSSSTRDNSTVNQAKAGLRSPAFHNLISLSHKLPATDGGASGLGYWLDGAEESRVVHVTDPTMLDTLAARLGAHFNQKQVLHFRTDPGGSDIAHVLTVPTADADRIAGDLARHGIEYKTIVPDAERDQSEVHIIDMGGSLTPNVESYAKESSAYRREHLGHASFLGSDTREGAAALFNQILSRK